MSASGAIAGAVLLVAVLTPAAASAADTTETTVPGSAPVPEVTSPAAIVELESRLSGGVALGGLGGLIIFGMRRRLRRAREA